MFYLTHQQRDWLDSISYVPAETIALLDVETTNDAAKALTDDELLTLSYILRDPITDIESSDTVSLSVIQKQLSLAPENHPILVSLIKKNVFCMSEGKIIFLGFKSDYPRHAPPVVTEPFIPAAAAEAEHHAQEVKSEKPVSPHPSNVEDLNTDAIRSLRESLGTIKSFLAPSREPAKTKKQKRFQALISLSSAETLLDILEERLAKAARIPASSPEGSAVTDSRREPAAVGEVAPEQLELNAELVLAYEEPGEPAQDNHLVNQIECYSPLIGQSLFQRTASPPPVVAVVDDIENEIEINTPKLS